MTTIQRYRERFYGKRRLIVDAKEELYQTAQGRSVREAKRSDVDDILLNINNTLEHANSIVRELEGAKWHFENSVKIIEEI